MDPNEKQLDGEPCVAPNTMEHRLSPQPLTVRVPVHAIDVGYQNTKFTYCRKTVGGKSLIAADLFPSLAARVTTTLAADGHIAEKDDGFKVHAGGCEYFVGKDVMNHMSGRESRSLAPDFSQSSKYTALSFGAFRYLIKSLGSPAHMAIEHLTVGLPLNTYLMYRSALRERMEGEHQVGDHTVSVAKVHVLPQPQGALLYHASKSGSTLDGWTLVIDIGGGTMDWYVANKQRPNFERSGAYPKAMLACAQAVADSMRVPDWRDNHEIIGRIDRAIRKGDTSFRADLEDHPLLPHLPAVEAVMDEAATRMLEKLGPMAEFEHVILTGGGAKPFHRFLLRKWPKLERAVRAEPDPVFCNVMGFHLFGELHHGRDAAV